MKQQLIIVNRTSISSLEHDVNHLLGLGYKLHGRIFSVTILEDYGDKEDTRYVTTYHQMMTFYGTQTVEESK
jgi:hypothetical protein